MKIKITDCSDCMYWYRDKIGKIFLVRRKDTDRYWCREDNEFGFLNFVLFKDCEVLKEED